MIDRSTSVVYFRWSVYTSAEYFRWSVCSFVTVQDWERQLGPRLKENLKSSECEHHVPLVWGLALSWVWVWSMTWVSSLTPCKHLLASSFLCSVSPFIFRLVLLNKVLEDGNCLYRKGRLEEAEQRYRCGLRKVFVLTHVTLSISWWPSEDICLHIYTLFERYPEPILKIFWMPSKDIHVHIYIFVFIQSHHLMRTAQFKWSVPLILLWTEIFMISM